VIEEDGAYSIWVGEMPSSSGEFGYEGYTLPYILALDCREIGTKRVAPRDCSGPVLEMASGSHGTLMGSRKSDNLIVVWDLETGAERASLAGNTNQRIDIAFSANGSLAATAEEHVTQVWDLETGTELVTVKTRGTSVALSPDGAMLAIGGWWSTIDHGTIQLWDVKTGTRLAVLEGHRGWVESVAFSADGTLLVAVSEDTVRLWNVETGTEVALLQGHNDSVTSVAFSPSGALIASGGKDGTVRLWDVQTGTGLTTLRAHNGLVQNLAFDPGLFSSTSLQHNSGCCPGSCSC
jgi:WD40 repeat protein